MSEQNLYLTIADFNLRIVFGKTKYKVRQEQLARSVKKYCAGFLSEECFSSNTDYTILVKEYLKTEMLLNNKQNKQYMFLYKLEKNNTVSTSYSDISQFRLLLMQIITLLLYKKGGFVFHSSSIFLGDKAILFSGDAETGKTTVARLLGKKYRIIESDSGIIRYRYGKHCLFQTPNYCILNKFNKSGRHSIIKKVYFLYKSNKFFIATLTNKQTVIKLLHNQVMQSKPYSKKQFRYIMKFAREIEFSKLYFAKNSARLIRFIEEDNKKS